MAHGSLDCSRPWACDLSPPMTINMLVSAQRSVPPKPSWSGQEGDQKGQRMNAESHQAHSVFVKNMQKGLGICRVDSNPAVLTESPAAAAPP